MLDLQMFDNKRILIITIIIIIIFNFKKWVNMHGTNIILTQLCKQKPS